MPTLLLGIIGSRIGQTALALIVGLAIGWWKTSAACDRQRAQAAALRAAANMQETARQEAAARELAAEATKRLAEAQEAADENARIIDELRKAESNAPQQTIIWKGRKVFVSDRPCGIDRDFVERLRKLRH